MSTASTKSLPFVFTDIGHHEHGPVFDGVVEFVNGFRADPGHPTERLFMSCGLYEGLIYYNRSLVPRLQEAGIEVPAPDELEEVAHVMSGLVAGPKGTVMKGQTDVLEVVEVQLDYLD